jgi:macrolide transport system ATP-binding/permease protein
MSVSTLEALNLVKIYGERRLFDGLSCTLAPGQRLGLVGENGAGKSTLLRLLAGTEAADDGVVRRPTDLGFLLQELENPLSNTVSDLLADALADSREALRRLEKLADRAQDPDCLHEYGEVLEWCTAHDAWDAERRAELVLDGLGLSTVESSRPLGTLSGGERARFALAALLIRRPAFLLLDEPTNHLDDHAISFLEQYIREMPGGVLVASHDRVFLDEVCTSILDLDPAVDGPSRYSGGYSDYLKEKRLERVRWTQQFAEEQEELKALRHSVNVTARSVAHGRGPTDNDKFIHAFKGARVQKQVSRRVRNVERRLDELERDQVRKPPAQLRFHGSLSSTVDGAGPPISLREVRVDGRLCLPRLDVGVDDRLLVTGSNGAGKSTLLAVLAGLVQVDSGEVLRHKGTRIGLLRQDVAFSEPERSAETIYTSNVHNGPPLAELGLIAGRDRNRPVAELSVGQRRRLALALLVAADPQVLLLDEPTNHLSLTLAGELEEALASAPGAVVVATHDRWLRRRWTGRELALDH